MHTPTAQELVNHMARYCTDGHVTNDLDAVHQAANDDKTRAIVKAYATARKRARGFKARSYRDNSHKAISPEVMAAVMAAGDHLDDEPAEWCCVECGDPVNSQRARYCGATCRKRAARAAA
ncbi:hypothetical protein AB0B97_29795 [Micromonospora sp. NPDC049004]|uniref:hypothetical protein n=1 Tax=Micromonospora sp. NPDC049004 TaxID=3154348 RepID=UPI0033F76C4A